MMLQYRAMHGIFPLTYWFLPDQCVIFFSLAYWFLPGQICRAYHYSVQFISNGLPTAHKAISLTDIQGFTIQQHHVFIVATTYNCHSHPVYFSSMLYFILITTTECKLWTQQGHYNIFNLILLIDTHISYLVWQVCCCGIWGNVTIWTLS